ncbi:PP2C family protein-serine/threonine phosphatase [Streptomyces sp. NPDC007861]|uniref:PP2C family protein-serine/threonine phosphatase n=1 Tax=Streptomyces sp. NPDC007861 TaxID=3154893 RepID=UPI0034057FF4
MCSYCRSRFLLDPAGMASSFHLGATPGRRADSGTPHFSPSTLHTHRSRPATRQRAAGSRRPLLIRGGRRITHLECPPYHPLGTELGLPLTVCQEQLQTGDRIVLYTDGITEARDSEGREFGLDRFIDCILRHEADELPVPETLRRLIHAVVDHHHGKLKDDATVLLCEWHGPTSHTPAH